MNSKMKPISEVRIASTYVGISQKVAASANDSRADHTQSR